MKKLFELFYTFAKIGLTTFGGGYAMLPILEHETVIKHKWITSEELTDYYAIGQCTPGVISVNIATFIGYKQKRILGAIIATFGIVFPSVIIILIIANFITVYKNISYLQNAFNGIRICVGSLIISAVLKLWKANIPDKFSFLIFTAAFILSLIFNISPIILLLAAGLAQLGLVKKESIHD